MAVYQFSALSDGQAISFDPDADVLNFDQTAISAGSLRATIEGSNLRLTVASGTGAGKDVLLLNVAPTQLALSNVTFANGSRLHFGDGAVGTANDNFSNTIGGTAGADHLAGLGGNDNLSGASGNDWLEGGAGQDVMTGGAGADSFVFRDTPFNSNYDRVMDFASGTDKVLLHEDAYADVGAPGNFSAGDARFYAAAGATAGHDADDRIIYNTSNGYLFYDADGSGAGRALFMGIVQGAPTLVASDIAVFSDEVASPPGGGATNGDDTLVGTPGNDTIDGLGGNDSISGLAGDDSLIGGDGNDTLDGGDGFDTMDGGLGDDIYFVEESETVTDPGGIDTVMLMRGQRFSLGPGLENLVLDANYFRDPHVVDIVLDGNEGNNLIRVDAEPVLPWIFIDGRGGADTLIGGDGNEAFSGDSDDSIDGGAGGDVLFASGDMLANPIRFVNIEAIAGGLGDDRLVADDTGMRLHGSDGDDTLSGGAGDDFLDGDADFFNGFDLFSGNDLLLGGAGNDTLFGGVRGGDNDTQDTLDGGTGNDTLGGESGADVFLFTAVPGAANADTILDLSSGTDAIHLDAAVMASLGASGPFAPNDPRFFAGAGASSGQDASDRVVYDTTSGQLWYDADGSGTAAAQLIATLQGAPTLVAADIVVVGQSGPGPIVGTSGDDSLAGTSGNDTIDGLGGKDTIDGRGGSDSLVGGAGNDLIAGGMFDPFTAEGGDVYVGGEGDDTLDGRNSTFAGEDLNVDTMDGGLGNDEYVVDNDDVLTDAGGTDTVVALNRDWTLGAGFENLVLNSDETEAHATGIGNELANHMRITWAGVLRGGGGDDTLVSGASFKVNELHGNDGNDVLLGTFSDILDGGAGNDTLSGGWTMTGGGGADRFELADQVNVTDFASGLDKLRLNGDQLDNVGPTGNFAAGDERFYAAAGATGAHDDTDRLIYNTTTGELFYDPDGTSPAAISFMASLQGAPTLLVSDIEVMNGTAPAFNVINGTGGSDALSGTAGNDSISGFGGNDTLNGAAGNDWLEGGTGQDNLTGGDGADSFVFRDMPLNTNYDRVFNFASGTDELVFDNDAYTTIGALGDFAAGDGRFYAAAGAVRGHDADDRIIYNTSNGTLYYDADGSGAGREMFIGVLHGAPALDASDIAII